jgi:hypothetical protein
VKPMVLVSVVSSLRVGGSLAVLFREDYPLQFGLWLLLFILRGN